MPPFAAPTKWAERLGATSRLQAKHITATPDGTIYYELPFVAPAR